MCTKTSAREPFFDIAKGICIQFVIITHLNWFGLQNLLLFPYWIEMAVPIFMIISGYLYARSMQNAGIGNLRQAYGVHRLEKEIMRFAVPFSLMFLIEQLLELISMEGGGKSPKEYIGSYFVGGTGQGNYYYPIMLQFVFLFPLVFAVVRNSKWGVLQCFAANAAYELFAKIFCMTDYCYRLLVFRYIFAIAYGCALAVGADRIKKKFRLATWSAGTIYIFLVNYTSFHPHLSFGWAGTSFISVLYILPIFEFFYVHMRNVRCKFLEIMGKASFDIYLVQKVYTFYDDKIWNDLIGRYPNPIIQVFAAVLTCSICGILFYHVEIRVLKCIMKVVDKINSYFDPEKIARLVFE